jgi:hypothetical protein
MLGLFSGEPNANVPAPDADVCKREETGWEPDDKVAWTRICRQGGVLNNVDRAFSSGTDADGDETKGEEPKDEEIKNEPRVPPKNKLSGKFIYDILTRTPYRERLMKTGLTLSEVRIDSLLDLTSTSIPGVKFKRVNFEKGISVDNATVSGDLEFNDVYTKTFSIESAYVTGALRLINVEIQHMDIDSSCIFPKMTAGGVVADGKSLIENPGENTALYLSNANFNSGLKLENGAYSTIVADNVQINGMLEFKKIIVENTIAHCSDAFDESLNLDSLRVSGSASIVSSAFRQRVTVMNGVLERSLQLTGTEFDSALSLDGSKISGNLIFATDVGSAGCDDSKPRDIGDSVQWGPDSELGLNGTSVSRIVAAKCLLRWPHYIDLRNFKFESFLKARRDETKELLTEEWYPKWIALGVRRDDTKKLPVGLVFGTVSSQTYSQISHYLTLADDPDAARKVAIAGNDAERCAACRRVDVVTCVLMATSWALIGYGYRLWLSIVWAAFFIVVGALVVRRTPEAKDTTPYGFVYSFDMFTPIIKLREHEFEVKGRARYYFYFHKLAGWVLVSFIAAALAGLTK